MLSGMDGTEAFFREMAPTLVANILTAVAIYSAWLYSQAEARKDVGKGTLIVWVVLPILAGLYGLYLWGVYPLKTSQLQPAQQQYQVVPSAHAQSPEDAGSASEAATPLDTP